MCCVLHIKPFFLRTRRHPAHPPVSVPILLETLALLSLVVTTPKLVNSTRSRKVTRVRENSTRTYNILRGLTTPFYIYIPGIYINSDLKKYRLRIILLGPGPRYTLISRFFNFCLKYTICFSSCVYYLPFFICFSS